MPIRCFVALLACLLASPAGAAPSVSTLVERLNHRFAGLADYSCTLESELRGERSTRRGTYEIRFKKPELMRIKVVRGPNRGSEISLTASGRVRAHGGGLLKAVVLTLSRDDRRLRDPRGHLVWEAGLGALLARLEGNVARTAKPAVVELPGKPGRVELKLAFQDPTRDVPIRESWTIDTEQWLITALATHEDGALVEQLEFQEFRLNTGLTDDDFEL